MGRVAEPSRVELAKTATTDTAKVAAWIAVSGAVAAILGWALDRPDFAQWYGIINILLYALKEVKKIVEVK